MTDYATRITVSSKKIEQLLMALSLISLKTHEDFSKISLLHEMLANEYRELAKTLEDMEKKGTKP